MGEKIDQWNRIGRPEIDPHNYSQLKFDKVAKVKQYSKGSFFNKLCWKNGTSIWEKVNYIEPYTTHKNSFEMDLLLNI